MTVRRRTGRGLALGLLAVAGVGTVAGVATTSASPDDDAAADRPPVVDDHAQTSGAGAHDPMLLTGDFDGDGLDDVLWYGPGDDPDHHWFGRPDRLFGGKAVDIPGVRTPVVGDFDGDGRSDVVWTVGAEGGTGAVWYGGQDHGFDDGSVPMPGAAPPTVGDFDGDRRDDLLWNLDGERLALWRGTGERGWAVNLVPVAVSPSAEPVVGDFDGDGRDDVLWHDTGDGEAVVRYGSADGSSVDRLRVDAAHRPFVGDFDGDGRDDVLWVGADSGERGRGAELWYGGDPGFARNMVRLPRAEAPVVGDFDGDGRADVLWPGSGDATLVWRGTAERAWAVETLDAMTPPASAEPVVGDFDGDGRDDVLWCDVGPEPDVVWFAEPGGGFVPRPTTIDLSQELAEPLRPESVVESYTPFGYIAHAAGGYEGHRYTNSLEAFLHNYERGFRVFELDFVVLADGTVFAAHTGLEEAYGLDVEFKEATWEDLRGRDFGDEYTALRSQDVVELLRRYPDVYVLLDTKTGHEHVFRTFVEQTGGDPALMERVLPHIKDLDELYRYRQAWPLRNYVFALYRSQYLDGPDDDELVEIVRDVRVPAVMIWWKERDPSLTLGQNHFESRRFTPELVADLQAAGAVPMVHTLRYDEEVPRFAELGVAVYSDGPFDVPLPDAPPVSPVSADDADPDAPGAAAERP